MAAAALRARVRQVGTLCELQGGGLATIGLVGLGEPMDSRPARIKQHLARGRRLHVTERGAVDVLAALSATDRKQAVVVRAQAGRRSVDITVPVAELRAVAGRR
jgi:hypothetical protein